MHFANKPCLKPNPYMAVLAVKRLNALYANNNNDTDIVTQLNRQVVKSSYKTINGSNSLVNHTILWGGTYRLEIISAPCNR